MAKNSMPTEKFHDFHDVQVPVRDEMMGLENV